jgi:hypothetical protein
MAGMLVIVRCKTGVFNQFFHPSDWRSRKTNSGGKAREEATVEVGLTVPVSHRGD